MSGDRGLLAKSPAATLLALRWAVRIVSEVLGFLLAVLPSELDRLVSLAVFADLGVGCWLGGAEDCCDIGCAGGRAVSIATNSCCV